MIVLRCTPKLLDTEGLARSVGDVLAALGVAADVIERECAAMSEVQYARTDDRSTVGVLTELQRLLHVHLEHVPVAQVGCNRSRFGGWR